jgi:Fumarylacetoacetate (FAA) hydrolase family
MSLVWMPSLRVALAGPGAHVLLEAVSEVRRGPNLAQQSMSSALGYTTGNDALEPDRQKGEGQWIRAKGFGGFCPLAPWIKTCLAARGAGRSGSELPARAEPAHRDSEPRGWFNPRVPARGLPWVDGPR